MAWLCLALVLTVTSLSAFIRLSRAGLGCADRAACHTHARLAAHDRAVPLADSSAVMAARMTHRVSASAALLLVLLIVMTAFATPNRWPVAGLALALLGLVLMLALLGRWSADARIPALTLANLLGGFLLAGCAWLLLRGTGALAAARAPTALQRWARLAVLALLAEVALGGLVGANFAGMACPGLVCSAPQLPWQAFAAWREPLLDAHGITVGAEGLQQAHRLGALLLVALLVPLALQALHHGRRRAGVVLLGLLLLQVLLGLGLVVAALPLPLALAHNIVAVLLLLTLLELARATPASAMRWR